MRSPCIWRSDLGGWGSVYMNEQKVAIKGRIIMDIRKFFLWLLSLIIVFMAACGKDEGRDPMSATMETPFSTYRFTQIHEVPGISRGSTFFQTMNKTEDGFSVLYADSQGNLLESRTTDGGDTWIEQNIAVDFLDGENGVISKSDVNQADGYAILVMKLTEENAFGGYQVVYVDGSGKVLIAEYTENINAIRFNDAKDAILVCTDYEAEEYGLDGRLLRSYPVTDVIDICFAEGKILFLTIDAIKVYDGTSGELVAEDSVFNDTMAEELQAVYNHVSSYDILNNHEIMQPDGSGAVTVLLDSGMYRYVVGSSVIECIYSTSRSGVDRLDNTLSFVREGELFYLLGYLENDDTLYFVCCSETDEAVEPVEDIPEKEITLYTLYSQAYLEETVRQFEEEYPGITVKIEVGREEGSNTTIMEAVNALNTKLLAGDGPDIILMDDLNFAAYRDSGMLAELSDLYDEILEKNPECHTALLSCYQTEDGEIYAIPSQFGFTVISAPSDSMNSLNSLEGLAEYIQNSPYPNPEYGNDLQIYDATDLFLTLYPAYSHRIFGNGESYDRQELEKFIYGYKEVWDALMVHTTEEQIREWEALVAEKGPWIYSNVNRRCYGLKDHIERTNMYVENIQAESGRSIGLYSFYYYIDVFNILEITRAYQNETYGVFAYDDVKTFTPLLVYSINAKCENMDVAEQFVQYMLSTEVQEKIAVGYYDSNGEHSFGMPVNMEGMLNSFENLEKEVMPAQEMNPGWYTFLDGERDYFMSLIESLSVPAYRNAVLEEKIRLNLQSYLDDEITLEQYMEEADNAIMLYMEE